MPILGYINLCNEWGWLQTCVLVHKSGIGRHTVWPPGQYWAQRHPTIPRIGEPCTPTLESGGPDCNGQFLRALKELLRGEKPEQLIIQFAVSSTVVLCMGAGALLWALKMPWEKPGSPASILIIWVARFFTLLFDLILQLSWLKVKLTSNQRSWSPGQFPCQWFGDANQ